MLDRFYQIVDSSDWLERFLPLGLKLVQLRIKEMEQLQLRDQIARSIELCRKYKTTLIVNDYWQLAIDLNADFIHLGQEDLLSADFAAIKRAGLKVGISTHSDEELEVALEYNPDYVALGPIYPTILKKMKWKPQGLERIGIWKDRITCPLVAIGGITLKRAPEVFSAGADSICVVTDVLYHDSPESRMRSWLDARNQWKIRHDS